MNGKGKKKNMDRTGATQEGAGGDTNRRETRVSYRRGINRGASSGKRKKRRGVGNNNGKKALWNTEKKLGTVPHLMG